MPELPEVEIHARNLRRWLVGKRIERFEVLDPKLAPDASPVPWDSVLPGREVLEVRRLAKYLLVDLEGDHTLVAHLRMTGRFTHSGYRAGPPPKATRLILHLAGGEEVRFQDLRRFGRIWVTRTDEVPALPELCGIGPDALLTPISFERLLEACRGTRRPVKVLLLDQAVVGGIGNICAIEILFRARIAPEVPASELSEEQVRRIADLIPRFMEWAIEAQSRRELIYLGEKGAENVFSIYRRAGTPCPLCGTPILRTVLGGRGTFHCPQCQRREGEETAATQHGEQ